MELRMKNLFNKWCGLSAHIQAISVMVTVALFMVTVFILAMMFPKGMIIAVKVLLLLVVLAFCYTMLYVTFKGLKQ